MTLTKSEQAEMAELLERFNQELANLQANQTLLAQQIMYGLLIKHLTPKRPGVLGRIARYFRWSWGWLPIPEQEAQALLKLAKEWSIVE